MPLVDESRDERDHLGDVVGRLGHDVRLEDVELAAIVHELLGVLTGQCLGVAALALGREHHPIFALVDVADDVADIGDVHHGLHAVPEVFERAALNVRHDVAIEVPDRLPVVDRRAAVVDPGLTRDERNEGLDLTTRAVEEPDTRRGHDRDGYLSLLVQ